MPAVQVRELDKGTYDRLAASARASHRSLSQEMCHAIETYLNLEGMPGGGGEDVRHLRRRGILEQIRAEGPVVLVGGLPAPEELVREDRDAR